MSNLSIGMMTQSIKSLSDTSLRVCRSEPSEESHLTLRFLLPYERMRRV